MKLVNPDFLGITIDYKFKGIELECSDFKDPYTGCLYAETGCYGCRNLSIARWGALECKKKHTVSLITVRNEEGIMLENCPAFASRRMRYGQAGCGGCDHKFHGANRTKCRQKFDVSAEIMRA